MAGASLRVGANTSEFTSQMKSMLTQMKLVTSEYKVEAAQAKALGSQTDLLKAKKTELTSKINYNVGCYTGSGYSRICRHK